MFEKARSFLLDEDRGVSPVIGVILMVAITVILAAVIATFVMNMGPQENSPANSQLSWTTDTSAANPVVAIEHNGGEPLPVGEYSVNYDGSSSDSKPLETAVTGSSLSSTVDSDTKLEAGDAINIDGSDFSGSPTLSDGDTLTLVWEDPGSDQTQIIEEYEVNT